MKKKILSILLASTVTISTLFGGVNVSVAAETNSVGTPDGDVAVRTILLYDVGADLETNAGMATYNLVQAMNADFDDRVNFIVMTGGSNEWQTKSEYLQDENGKTIDKISSEYNQIWKLTGKAENGEHGKMTLLDDDGIMGDGEAALKAADEIMSDPKTLTAFINYCKKMFPAQNYDLILWNHGGGPVSGFGIDEHYDVENEKATSDPDYQNIMSLDNIANAIEKSDVDSFDFIDFDACLMSSIEIAMALEQYTEYLIVSAETEPGYGQEYSGWLNMLGDNPDTDTYTLGKKIVDDFITFYETEDSDGYGQNGTLAIYKPTELLEKLMGPLNEIAEIMIEEAESADAGTYNFYDEILSSWEAINYGGQPLEDLGIFVDQLGVSISEIDDIEDAIDNELKNKYTKASNEIKKTLQDSDVIYARSTKNMEKESTTSITRDVDGNWKFASTVAPTGISIFFSSRAYIEEYSNDVTDKIIKRTKNQNVKTFLEKWERVLSDYAIIMWTGSRLTKFVNEGESADFSKIRDYLKDDSNWLYIAPVFSLKEGRDVANVDDISAETIKWLEGIVEQQQKEIISDDKVKADMVLTEDNSLKYHADLSNVPATRVIRDMYMNISAKSTSFDEYVESLNDTERMVFELLKDYVRIDIGTIKGSGDFAVDGRISLDSISDALNSQMTTWDFEQFDNKWYAVIDKNNVTHAVNYEEDDGIGYFPVTYGEKEGDNDGWAYFMVKYDSEKNVGEPYGVAFIDENAPIILSFDELTDYAKGLYMRPVSVVDFFGMYTFYIPISSTSFKCSDFAELKKVDISELANDITDVEPEFTVEDIYGGTRNLTSLFNDSEKRAREGEYLIDIKRTDIEIPDLPYTGESREPDVTVTYQGETLEKGVDYVVSYFGSEMVMEGSVTIYGIGKYAGSVDLDYNVVAADINNAEVKLSAKTFTYNGKKQKPDVKVSMAGITSDDFTVEYPADTKSAGTKTIKVKAKGTNFAGTKTVTYKIKKGGTSFELKASKDSIKAVDLKKKAASVKIKITKLSAGSSAPKFTVKSVSNGQKNKISVNKKTGKVTIKKGTKKCKIVINVKSAANNNRSAKSKTVTIKVK